MTQPFESLGIQEMQFRQGTDSVDPTVDIPDNSGVYGFGEKGYGRPELLAPSEEDVGGFLFLPGTIQQETLHQLVYLAGMASTERVRQDQYGLQVIDSPEGLERQLGYMRKLIIANRFALRFLFRVVSEIDYDTIHQPLDVEELVQKFVEDERKKYGTSFGGSKLAGRFGGDGDFAQEALGFGFAIENHYHKVISIWSRGWLSTK